MRLFILVVVVITSGGVAGCAGEDLAALRSTSSSHARVPPQCTPMQPGTNTKYLYCHTRKTGDRGSFYFVGRGDIPIDLPTKSPAGHWSGGYLSPDGRTLLAQWSAECEVPFAFFVSSRGGTPCLVTGEVDM